MSNQNNKLEQVKRSCAITQKVLTVVKVIFIVASIFFIIGTTSCFVARDYLNDKVSDAVESGKMNVEAANFELGGVLTFYANADESFAAGKYAEVFAGYCIIGLVITVVLAGIITQFAKIFAIIEKSETPFCEEVLNKLKRVFIVLVVFIGLFSSIGNAFFLGLFLWCVYTILDYGITLQTEVDETL